MKSKEEIRNHNSNNENDFNCDDHEIAVIERNSKAIARRNEKGSAISESNDYVDGHP